MPAVVEARELVKHYGDVAAVRGIAFTVAAGECFGFLGPNGAGKTSVMRMLGCQSPVTSGTLAVLGQPVGIHARAVKAQLGVVPQGDTLDEDLSVRENLEIYAGYFGLPRAERRSRTVAALTQVALAERADDDVDELSGGMRRRVTLARALLNEPKVLLLDEPTTGLDPAARRSLWSALRALKERGATLILTTHYMEEAAVLCDRLVVLHEGRIVAEGSPLEVIRRHAGEVVVEARATDAAVRTRVREALRAAGGEVTEAGDTVYAFGGTRVDPAAPAYAGAAVAVRAANLEDAFLRLTGHALEE